MKNNIGASKDLPQASFLEPSPMLSNYPGARESLRMKGL